MTTATIASKCPAWCRTKEVEDHAADGGHDGPSWPSLPRDGGFNSLEIFAGANQEGQIFVHARTGYGVGLTAEEAITAGRYLIEAAQWALAHRVA